MNTSYDEIWELFLTNVWVEGTDLPETKDGIYLAIGNAVKLYNNKLRDNLICSNTLEEVNRKLNDDELLIIAHYIRLTLLKNQLTFKNSIFDTFTKEIGYKNIGVQLRSLREEIDSEEKTINGLIFNADDSEIM